MADRDDPTYRGAAGSAPTQGEPATAPESDPLAELARIVSGGSDDAAATRRLSGSERLTARASEHNLARDLEAELLENLRHRSMPSAPRWMEASRLTVRPPMRRLNPKTR
jgi:alpha-beta hydrolase superfamily lysophospholipase